ncbi:MAG: MarR family winged helix-turn-helix transcriptional regulator [Acidimicrobiales bacterium]
MGTPTDQELVELLLAVVGPLKQHFAECASEFDLSFLQAVALRELAVPRSMRELADRLCCDASNVTGLIDRLEARDLVLRQVRPADRRVKQLVLTRAGKALQRRLTERVLSGPTVFGVLSGDDRRRLSALLGRMLEAQAPD